MEREHSTASEAASPAKKAAPKSSTEMLHKIQNLIPNGVANIQWKLQALKHTLYIVLEFSYAHHGEADRKLRRQWDYTKSDIMGWDYTKSVTMR